MMNWGSELWDQFDNISAHTNKGIDCLEKFGHFVRDRAAIECEYAYKLRRLIKNYQPKKKEEEDHQYSSCRAFKLLLNEVNDVAGQHEVVAENFQLQVFKELTALLKELRDDRKKCLNDGIKLQQNLQSQVECLIRAKKSYDKAYKEADKAVENFQKADADLNLSRAEVEKQRSNMNQKNQQCEASKNEYADQLQRTNDLQRQHYRSGLPEVFRQFQALDEKRIKNVKNFMKSLAEIERNVFPIINTCLDGIVKASEIINEKEDSLLVIEKYKSGFNPPEDIPFEDLSKGGSDSGSSTNINSLHIGAKVKDGGLTVKGTISGKGIKKRAGLLGIFGSRGNATLSDGKEDFSDLAPNQRKKKLKQRVEELQSKVYQETAARNGLMKMKIVYEGNPALGDPMTIEGQLNESSHKLDKLKTELKRYEGYLEDAMRNVIQQNNSQTNSPKLQNGSSSSSSNNTTRNHRNSGGSAAEEESLSRSASDSSVTNPTLNHNKQSAPGTPQLNNGCSNSPESGLGTSRTSLHAGDSDQDQYEANSGENGREFYDNIYEPELLPALGTCKALYPFDATSEGSIPMQENEELYLIEKDQGDGWTRVRRMNGEYEEGFVPTSYIETTMFNT